MKHVWIVEHRIYEESVGPDYPVVEHKFRGRTRAEAEGYYQAHLQSDKFLKACNSARGGLFQGSVRCRGFIRVYKSPAKRRVKGR